ncbi:MAG: hypothetical protein K0S40_217 [Actinomycetospora sp.]|nr:hypothetical protein [Actinomycetospora sp.]
MQRLIHGWRESCRASRRTKAGWAPENSPRTGTARGARRVRSRRAERRRPGRRRPPAPAAREHRGRRAGRRRGRPRRRGPSRGRGRAAADGHRGDPQPVVGEPRRDPVPGAGAVGEAVQARHPGAVCALHPGPDRASWRVTVVCSVGVTTVYLRFRETWLRRSVSPEWPDGKSGGARPARPRRGSRAHARVGDRGVVGVARCQPGRRRGRPRAGRASRAAAIDYTAMSHVLAAEVPRGPFELGRRLGISSGSATELVDLLERAGHLPRSSRPSPPAPGIGLTVAVAVELRGARRRGQDPGARRGPRSSDVGSGWAARSTGARRTSGGPDVVAAEPGAPHRGRARRTSGGQPTHGAARHRGSLRGWRADLLDVRARRRVRVARPAAATPRGRHQLAGTTAAAPAGTRADRAAGRHAGGGARPPAASPAAT